MMSVTIQGMSQTQSSHIQNFIFRLQFDTFLDLSQRCPVRAVNTHYRAVQVPPGIKDAIEDVSYSFPSDFGNSAVGTVILQVRRLIQTGKNLTIPVNGPLGNISPLQQTAVLLGDDCGRTDGPDFCGDVMQREWPLDGVCEGGSRRCRRTGESI
jgi:hypothetical protein